jgi:hypothetical protein
LERKGAVITARVVCAQKIVKVGIFEPNTGPLSHLKSFSYEICYKVFFVGLKNGESLRGDGNFFEVLVW